MADTLAARLRALREKAGFTRYALAKKADLSPIQYARIEEGGDGSKATFATVASVARALGVSLAAFDGVTLPEK